MVEPCPSFFFYAGTDTKKATKHNVLLPKKSSKCYEKIIL